MASIRLNILYVILGSLLATSSASAKVYLNSMCTMMADSKDKKIEGDDKKKEKFPLASISKVVTSLWAVEKLGTEFRFTTKIHVTKGNSGYNVHIEGGRDPIFGRRAGYFLLSQLNRKGIEITEIENLTFDENFLLAWQVEEDLVSMRTPFYKTIEKQVAAVGNEIAENLVTPVSPAQYNLVRKQAEEIGVALPTLVPNISAKHIDFVTKADFKKSPDTKTFIYQSAPLRTILKRMNNQSNNYIADHIYWNLGGTTEFNKFITKTLSIGTDEMEFHLGSGNNANYLEGSADNIYNEATCEAMIKVLYKADALLANQGMDLSSIMAVAGKDNSTIGGYAEPFKSAMIAKTGTVSKARTLAGSVSTTEGNIYFVVLMHMDRLGQSGEAIGEIQGKVRKLIKENGGPSQFEYKAKPPLPFDAGSKLQIEMDLAKKG